MGFKEYVERIIRKCRGEGQTLLFSAIATKEEG
jgi:superfamily II DNA/RNA helicase